MKCLSKKSYALLLTKLHRECSTVTKSVMSWEFKTQYQSEWTNMLHVGRGFHSLHSTDNFSMISHLIPELGPNTSPEHSLLWCSGNTITWGRNEPVLQRQKLCHLLFSTKVGETRCPEIRSRQPAPGCRNSSNSLHRGPCLWPSVLAWSLQENDCPL